MNRFNLLSSKLAIGAILLLLVSSSAAFAQVNYVITGTLDLVSGTDPLMLNGQTVKAKSTISQTMTPSSSSTTSTSSTNVYSGVTVTLAGIDCTVPSTPPVTVTLTDNVGAPDTISIDGCNLAGLATVAAAVAIPDGNMITAVPANIPLTNVTGSITANLEGAITVFDLTNATIVATGAAPPAVTPSPAAWTPSAQMGSTTSLTQPVTFTAPTPANEAVSFSTSVTTTDGGSWLSVTPAGTNTSSSINITVNPTGLTAPSYTGTVFLNYGTSGVAATQIPVTFTITAPSVTLTGPGSMTFNYTLGDASGPPSQQLMIGSSPASSVAVSAAVTSGNSWLSVSPGSGSVPASFTVSVSTASLTAQTYNGNIQITSAGATNSPFNVPVSFVVAPSTLTVPTTPLTFTYTIGSTAPAAQLVNITGTTGISFTTSPATNSGGSWLAATMSGTVPSNVSISINTAGLTTAAQYTGSVTINSTGATGSGTAIPVTLNVVAPVLTASPSPLNFSVPLGSGTEPASQAITVGDASNVNFTATAATTSGGSWLAVSPGSGSTSGSVNVSVMNTSGLAAGIYNGTVTIAATGATSQVVNVTLTVAAVTVSTSSLNFAFQTGGTTPAAQPVNIGGTSGLGFTATAATIPPGGTWLSVNPTGGTISNSSSISVSVITTGLAPNTYTGTITVAAPGAVSQVVSVSFVVSNNATVSASPSSLNFAYTIGGAAPVAQGITVGGSTGLTFTATPATTSGGSWLSATPVSPATIPGSASVSIVTTGLTTPGTYNGTVTIGATGATSQVVTVTLVVSSTVTATPTSLSFNYTIGGAAPAAQSLTIGGSSGITFTATPGTTSGGSWLSATAVSPGTVPGSASVSIVTTGLTTPGTFSGTVTIGSTGATSVAVPVTLVVSPNVTAMPTSLTFNYTLGGTAPVAQTLTIGGTPGISFTAAVATSSGLSWLAAAPVSPGTVPGSASVSIITSGLTTAGTYNGTVTIGATGATSVVVPVTLVVSPNLTAMPTSLTFNYAIGGTAPAAQTLTIGGTAGITFTAVSATIPSGGTWLSASPVAPGTVPGSASVSIVTTGLTTAATYNGTVTIGATGATSVVVPVTLVVTAPSVTATPTSLSFAYQLDGTTPATQTLTIGGASGITYTATAATVPSGGTWLSAIPSGPGTVPGSVSVSINPTSLTTVGTYKGTVTIGANGATSVVVPVTLVVTTAPITASPTSLSFTYVIGKTLPAEQGINIDGGSQLAFTAAPGAGASWLAVSPTSGSLTILLTVSVNPANLTAGTYKSNIIVTAAGAPNSPFSIPVTLTVSGGASTITVTPSTLNFTANTGGAAPASQTLKVTGTTATAVTVSSVGGPWLTASAVQPATTPTAVTVSVNPGNLAAGTYTGTVIVTGAGAANSPQNIAVTFVISTPPTITVTPANVNFTYTVGSANPGSQSVSVTSSSPVSISTSILNGSWLSVSATSTVTPSTLMFSVNPKGLTIGSYSASVPVLGVGASNSPQTITVNLVVTGTSAFAGSPSSLTFTTPSGGPNPAAQSIALTSGAALPFNVATTPSWLNVSASSSTTPATLVATVNIKGMAQGSYQGSITVTSTTSGGNPLTIPVTLNLTAPQLITGPTISSVVSAASYASNAFSAGGIASIFGSLLGPQTGASFSVNSQGTLNDSLAGVSVTAGGLPAIPLYVQNGQINFILPSTLGASGQAAVQVQYNNQTSLEFNINLEPANVQIFTTNMSGSGPGAILNQDFTVNTAANPAPPATVVQVYGTGGGVLNPAVTSGDVAGDNPLSWVTLQYSATVNGENATVLYAGSAPGLVYGVYQFNVLLPADLKAGPATIVLTVGNSQSQSNVTVFVK